MEFGEMLLDFVESTMSVHCIEGIDSISLEKGKVLSRRIEANRVNEVINGFSSGRDSNTNLNGGKVGSLG